MSRPPRRPSGPSSSTPHGASRRPGRDRDDFSTRPGSREGTKAPRGPRPEGRSGETHGERGEDRPRGRPGFAARREDSVPAPRFRQERPEPRGPRPQHDRQHARAPEADAPPRLPRDPGMAAPSGSLWLYGLHAVAAALANPKRRARRLLLTADAEEALLARLPRPWRLQAERVEKNRFQTFLTEDAVHQGAALLADPLPPADLEEAITASNGPVLLLDQVTDPRNVGAILRSAAAFGAAAVVMQDRNAPPETGALARTASGALEIVPVVREVNLSRTIQTLQKAGFWVMGLDGAAKRELAEAKPTDRRAALVLGAEDTGLRRLQRETCDELVRLPMMPEVESLNVSAAATVALYELVRKG